MSLQITTSSEANQNSPVAVDVVGVSNKKLLAVLTGLTANDWFQKDKCDQVQRDNPGKIQVLADLQLVPGQVYGPVKIKVDPKFVTGVLFVDYFTPGAHREVVDIHKPLVVNLGLNGFTVETGK